MLPRRSETIENHWKQWRPPIYQWRHRRGAGLYIKSRGYDGEPSRGKDTRCYTTCVTCHKDYGSPWKRSNFAQLGSDGFDPPPGAQAEQKEVDPKTAAQEIRSYIPRQ